MKKQFNNRNKSFLLIINEIKTKQKNKQLKN